MKKFLFMGVVAILITTTLTAAAPTPKVTFTLISGLPVNMNVGDQATVIVQVDSDQEFIFAQMLPTTYYPGRGVVAVQGDTGGDRTGNGTSATLEITFEAIDSADKFTGPFPVSVVVGTRFQGGYIASQQFDFLVTVP